MSDDLLPRLASQGERDRATFEQSVRAGHRKTRPARMADLEALQEGFARALGTFVADRIGPLQKRVAELEARIANFTYRGVWTEGEQYRLGNFVTHDGSLWHANANTEAKPGGGKDWQLAVKRGKDR